MIEILKYETKLLISTIEIREDRKSIAVFCSEPVDTRKFKKVAEFPIESLWDMLRDNLAVVDVGSSNAGLFRRKKEALAAIVKGMEI